MQFKNIAIVSPNKEVFSETFIKAHKEKLKGNIFYLHSGCYFPHFYGDNNIPLSSYFPNNKISILEKLLKLTPQVVYIRLKNQFFPEKKYSRIVALSNFLSIHNIDVVLAEYGTSGCDVLESCKMSNTKLIVNFLGFDASEKNTIREYGEQYISMFHYASKIIVNSDQMRKNIEMLGCDNSKIIINYCGPNDLFFDVKPTFSKKQFLATGRFVDKKAPYYTIFAFQKVLEKHPDAKLIIAGDGFLLNTCKNLVKMLEITDSVVFSGVISPDESRVLLHDSVAFVQHSITAESGDMEGTPVAILEASAAGLPVISTKHAGIPDVIIDKETGFLVEEHDVDGMAKNMISILDDFSLARKMGKAGQQRVKDLFTMEKHIAILQGIIDTL